MVCYTACKKISVSEFNFESSILNVPIRSRNKPIWETKHNNLFSQRIFFLLKDTPLINLYSYITCNLNESAFKGFTGFQMCYFPLFSIFFSV